VAGREPESPLAKAKAMALRALAARARSEAEIRAKLARAELGEVADEVVAWLRGLGYLDDRAFAAARARALLRPGRLGPRMAERRIAAAGVDAPEARGAVAEALELAGGGSQGELALCRALAQKRVRGDPRALPERDRARLARFLLGRGFSGSAVAQVVGSREDPEPDE
jgi:regulatory protein